MDLLLLRSIADKVSKEVVCHLEALLSLHLCGHAKRHDQGDTEENDLFAHIFFQLVCFIIDEHIHSIAKIQKR